MQPLRMLQGCGQTNAASPRGAKPNRTWNLQGVEHLDGGVRAVVERERARPRCAPAMPRAVDDDDAVIAGQIFDDAIERASVAVQTRPGEDRRTGPLVLDVKRPKTGRNRLRDVDGCLHILPAMYTHVNICS
jgi:hypothetical protein